MRKLAGSAEARAHHRAFLGGSSLGGRPCLVVTAKARGVSAESPAVPPDPKAADLDPGWHVARIESFLSSTLLLADAIPRADICVGRDVTDTAVLIGGDYDYRFDEAIIRREPGLLERPVPSFTAAHPLVTGLETIYRAVAASVGTRAYVNNVMTLDALTTMAQIRGQLELCRDLVDRPSWVAERAAAIQDVADRFSDHFAGLLGDLGYAQSSSWFDVVAEGRFDTLRSDFAVMLSPAMFERFAAPVLAQHAACLDHGLFNMDSIAMVRFLDILAGVPGLDGIYWNPGPQHSALLPRIHVLRDIRRRGLILEVQAATVDEAVVVIRELGPDGLLVSLPRFDALDAAERAVDTLAQATR